MATKKAAPKKIAPKKIAPKKIAPKKSSATTTIENGDSIGAHIENVHIDNRVDNTTNEHTRAAVVALAEAASKNAEAINQIARSLRGADVLNTGTGIQLSNMKGR